MCRGRGPVEEGGDGRVVGSGGCRCRGRGPVEDGGDGLGGVVVVVVVVVVVLLRLVVMVLYVPDKMFSLDLSIDIEF